MPYSQRIMRNVINGEINAKLSIKVKQCHGVSMCMEYHCLFVKEHKATDIKWNTMLSVTMKDNA